MKDVELTLKNLQRAYTIALENRDWMTCDDIADEIHMLRIEHGYRKEHPLTENVLIKEESK